ncbi:ricin B lectin domain-containing protein [Chytriomyces cf. hyalinus JEL632]|nr:ricin B lectin domain-containing protein [Chytriomyces cf. hyalinus JEL632]
MIRVLVFLTASSILAVSACPPNGREEPNLRNRCVCNPGFYWNDAACVPGPNNRGANGCPWHGHSNGNRCVCDQGYFWDGVECAQGANNYGRDGCPWHGHKGGSGACECDAGYFWDSTSCAEGSDSGLPPSDGAEVSFNNNGGCLDLYGGGGSGTRVNRWECLGNSNQQWTMRSDGTIRSSAQGLCLESAGVDNTMNGNSVRVWACTGGLNQQWDHNGSQLRNRRAQKCLDNTNGASTNGNPLQIWDCAGNTNQIWKKIMSQPAPPPPPPSSGGQILRNSAGCLDLYGNGGSGTKVVLWSCMGNSNQNWIQYADGTIRSEEKRLCLESAGLDNTGNGNLVQVWECHGQANQQWDVVGSSIKNRKSQKCLDNAFNQSNDGNRIQMWDCTGSPNQQWTYGEPMPGPQDPNTPSDCELSMQKVKVMEPDLSGGSVTFIDPDWERKLVQLLAGDRNHFREEAKDIPGEMVALVDRRYKYTVEYSGGFQTQGCIWETTSIIVSLILSNLRESAKEVNVINGPGQVTCSNNFNDFARLENSTAAFVFPPVVYRKLETAGTNSACTDHGSYMTPCGKISNCCECDIPPPTVTGWQVSTEAFIRARPEKYDGKLLELKLNIKSSKACDSFFSDALDFVFDITDKFLPFMPFKSNQKDKIKDIMAGMQSVSENVSKFTNLKCK